MVVRRSHASRTDDRLGTGTTGDDRSYQQAAAGDGDDGILSRSRCLDGWMDGWMDGATPRVQSL